MGTETVADALEREHHEIDGGIEAFTAAITGGITGGTPDRRPLVRAVAALRRHIYLEEEFLFPPLRAAGLVMPVLVMVREHGRMWRILDALDDELRDGNVRASVADLLRELQEQLAAHNPKEERILYPQTKQTLSVAATKELRELLETGHLPEGWVCEALRT